MDDNSIKEKIVNYSKKMITDSLTTGTGGNLSVKFNNRIYITPSGVEYDSLKAEDISVLDLDGNFLGIGKKPSSEKGFHLGIYQSRGDVSSIIHTHSTYSTILACLKKELPPIHYLVAIAGNKVPVAEYAKFGSDELGENILRVLKDYNAVFMANHGLMACGISVEAAYAVALNIEFVSEIYVKALGVGNPVVLTDQQIGDVEEKLNNYINPYL